MSNQCSNFCDYRSFSFCTPFLTPLKPYTTTRRRFFLFQHNLILIGRRSRRRSSCLPLKVSAQSSSDIVLIATKEHSDGSFVFRFGDASEVVENDDVEEEIESQTEEDSSVKVLDGDQDGQVIIKMADRGYDSVEGRLIEVTDDIGSADIDSDIAERETNATRDLSDYHAASSDTLSDISRKEALVSQSDANLNDSIKVVECTLDEAKFSVQLDEEESSDPTIYLLDNSPNIEKNACPEGTLLKGGDDKPVEASVSVDLESTQVSETEIMNDLDNMEAEDTSKSNTDNVSVELESMQVLPIEVMNELYMVETEDNRKNDAEEDVEEGLKDMIVNEGTLTDELPSSNPLVLRLMDAVTEDAEEELQDKNINEATIIDEMPSSDQLVVEQPILDEVSQPHSVDEKDQTMEDELQHVSTKNREENDVAYVMSVSRIEESNLVVEEEVSQPQSTPLEVKRTIQVLEIDLQDTLGHDLDNGILQVDNEIKDQSVSVNLEAIQVSDNEVMDVRKPYTEDESQMVESKDTSEGDTQDLPSSATMHVSDVDMDERLQDMNISEGIFTNKMATSGPLASEPTLVVSTTKGMDVKDVDMDERLQNMNINEDTFIDEIPTSVPLGAEPTLEVSATIGMDVKNVDTDEKLQDMNISECIFIDEMETSDLLGAERTLEVSTTKDMDVKNVDMDERLHDMNASEDTFIDEMPTCDPLGTEQALEVSTTKGVDVKDVDAHERLQDMNISEGPSIDEMLTSEPLTAGPTLEVSAIKDMVITDVDMGERLQDMNTSEGTLIDEMPTSDPSGAEPTLEVSTTEGLGVKDVGTHERLQDMTISEGAFIDEMPTSDPLGAEPTLEVSTTDGLGVKDLAIEAELQLVSNDNMCENLNADVMPAEPIVEEKVSQPHSTSLELKPTMEVSDIKVQDAAGQNLDDEILQVIGEDAGDSYIEDVEEVSHQLESQSLQDEGVNHNMLEQFAETDALESSILLKQGAYDPLLEAERTEGVAGSSELAEASEVTALLLSTKAEVEREEIYLTDDILLSGAAMFEHPFKALTGGDDAYFVTGSKWLGVASGVSQWSFEGTGPGVYAQEFMRTCEEIVLDTSSIPMTNPVELLCRGIKETNMSGSSSVLIANFNGQALHVANIGDTGFFIIRHGAVYKKSSPLLHEFHFALHVDDSNDPLHLVEEYLIVSKSLQARMKP